LDPAEVKRIRTESLAHYMRTKNQLIEKIKDMEVHQIVELKKKREQGWVKYQGGRGFSKKNRPIRL
jgi:hypothetical protein